MYNMKSLSNSKTGIIKVMVDMSHYNMLMEIQFLLHVYLIPIFNFGQTTMEILSHQVIVIPKILSVELKKLLE